MKENKDPNVLELKGKIIKIMPNGKYLVELLNKPHKLICHVSGKMRLNYIKLIENDIVKVQISKHDLTTGRITYRERVKPKFIPNKK